MISIHVSDDAILVDGDGVDDRASQLFFRGTLGCRKTDSGWTCPVRRDGGPALVVRIARWLQTNGREFDAGDALVDRAILRDLERARSYVRAHEAASAFLGLDGDPEARIDESTLQTQLASAGWRPERELRPHQIHGALHALHATNAANFSVPGAGKTAIALAVATSHLVAGTIDLVVVVGPLASFRPWETEAAAATGGALTVRRVRGAHRLARVEQYRRAERGEILVLSYATAVSDRAPLEELMRRTNVMFVVDESHRVKRFSGGQWAPALVSLARFARVRMILSGTPMPQGPRDLWSQFNILWPGEEVTGSRADYDARARRSFPGVIERLAPFFVRTPKEALGLTPPQVLVHPVPMTGLQKDLYELVASRLRLAAQTPGRDQIEALRRARPMRLLQVASNPDLLNSDDGFYQLPAVSTEDGVLVLNRLGTYRSSGELPCKFEWSLDFLGRLIAGGEKCVVWTNFIKNIDQFSRLVIDRLRVPTFSVDGRVPSASGDASEVDELDDTREIRIERFLGADGPAVLVANPAACGESISLHSACHSALYLDRTYDCARWLQSIDRIHRLGLPPDVTVEVHVPLAVMDSGGIDLLVDQSLDQKTARMQQLLEGAELRSLEGADSTAAAEGDDEDLAQLLRYLVGE